MLGSQYQKCPNPKRMQNNSPKPIITAIKAIILHTFGVQVVRSRANFRPTGIAKAARNRVIFCPVRNTSKAEAE